jgi:2-polyprenyl-3-methyl-5-hydroxy-6-metoxy-1,4-benzoquinol methylase
MSRLGRHTVARRLRWHLSQADPWYIETSHFGRARLAACAAILGETQRAARALEVGCGVGAFTEHLATKCDWLDVVDVMPEAIRRCRGRLGDQPHLRYCVMDIAEPGAISERYDLIVLCEVTYYIGSSDRIALAVDGVVDLIVSGGHLLFSSPSDDVAALWGYQCGAETVERLLLKRMRTVTTSTCRGLSPAECTVITLYEKADA